MELLACGLQHYHDNQEQANTYQEIVPSLALVPYLTQLFGTVAKADHQFGLTTQVERDIPIPVFLGLGDRWRDLAVLCHFHFTITFLAVDQVMCNTAGIPQAEHVNYHVTFKNALNSLHPPILIAKNGHTANMHMHLLIY